MDNYSKEDILKALSVIHDVCEQHEKCPKCPFFDGTHKCVILDKSPCYWVIADTFSVWRAVE